MAGEQQLGGFSFSVDADLSPAQRKLQQFVQQAQQSAQQVGQAFSGLRAEPVLLKADGTPFIRETQKAEEALEKVARKAKQLADRPSTITIRADVGEAQAGLDRLIARGREAGALRLNLQANVSNVKSAEAAVTQMAAALRGAKAGETINLNVRADSVERADATIKRLTADINAAKAAGARVAVNVQTNQQGGGALREIGRGFLQQATPGLATGAAAAAGVVGAQAVIAMVGALRDAAAAGVQYNAAMETASVQMGVFLGSTEASTIALQRFQKIAEETPFSLAEINRAGASFAQISGGDLKVLERYVELTTQLAAVNPNAATGGGIEGATTALREALSGDFTSIVERFRVSRSEVQRLRELGLTGEELAVALVTAAGGSKQLSDSLGDTFAGRAAKAAEILERLQGIASRPTFDVLNAGLAQFLSLVGGDSTDKLERFAAALGKIIAPNLGAQLLTPAGFGFAVAGAGFGAAQAPATPPPAGPSAQEQARQTAAEAHTRAVNEAQRALEAQRKVLKDLEGDQERIQQAARKVTLEYEQQLRPLEAQLRLLDAQQRANDVNQVNIANRRAAAGPPVEVRAEAARQTVLLDHEQELTEIRHRRAELSESIARAEFDAANRVAEAQIRSAERALEGTQQRVQGEREARQEALEGLREEIRGRQEARQAALDGMREDIQAVQEARRATLDAIREEIQARQEARREAIEGLREQISERRRLYDEAREDRDEARQAQQEAFQEQERQAERAHTISQDRYRDQIEALREQADAVEERVRRESSAQRELAAFERAENARQRAQTIASAERNVRQARTGRERADALQRLIEIRAQAAADAKREELQARITREREEADRRREQIQAKIADLERKARDEDRAYQRDRDNRREQFEAQQRAQAAQDRAEEKAERELRRNEDAQVRALEKADREATKREAAQIKALEKADREQTKFENAQLRAAEQADRELAKKEAAEIREAEKIAREEDRRAQRDILAQQQQIVDARNQLADRQEGAEAGFDAAALQRLREQVDLERQRLTIREGLLAASDPVAAAQAAADQVFADEVDRILAGRRTVIEGQIAAIGDAAEAELGGLHLALADLEIKIADAEARVKDLETALQATRSQLPSSVEGVLPAGSTGEEPGAARPGPLSGPPLSEAGPEAGGTFWGAIGVPDPETAFADIQEMFTNPEVWSETGRQIMETLWDSFIAAGDTIAGAGAGTAFAEELAGEIGAALPDGLEDQRPEMAQAIEDTLGDITDHELDSSLGDFEDFGEGSADAVGEGFEGARVETVLLRTLRRLIRAIDRLESAWRQTGRGQANEFTRGFAQTIETRFFPDLIPVLRRVNDRMVRIFQEMGRTAAHGFAATYRNQTAMESFAARSPGSGGSPSMTGRALGGPVFPWQAYIVGENGPEMFMPRTAGAIIPPALTMSTLAGGGLASINSRGAVSVSVNQTIHASPGMDTNALARVVTDQAVAAIIDVLDDAERRAPNPLSRILPGAVR